MAKRKKRKATRKICYTIKKGKRRGTRVCRKKGRRKSRR